MRLTENSWEIPPGQVITSVASESTRVHTVVLRSIDRQGALCSAKTAARLELIAFKGKKRVAKPAPLVVPDSDAK
jgi:hypothetical protein